MVCVTDQRKSGFSENRDRDDFQKLDSVRLVSVEKLFG